jgi:hypothetical protein
MWCFYRSNAFERPCISNLLTVIPSKSRHTPPLKAKKLLALPGTNGTQGLRMGCTNVVVGENIVRYTSHTNSSPFKDTYST